MLLGSWLADKDHASVLGSYILKSTDLHNVHSGIHTPQNHFHSCGYFATAFVTHLLIKVSGFLGSLKQST